MNIFNKGGHILRRIRTGKADQFIKGFYIVPVKFYHHAVRTSAYLDHGSVIGMERGVIVSVIGTAASFQTGTDAVATAQIYDPGLDIFRKLTVVQDISLVAEIGAVAAEVAVEIQGKEVIPYICIRPSGIQDDFMAVSLGLL